MNSNDLTLELLVREGNTKGVKEFMESKDYDEERKEEKFREAGIYSAINLMWREAEGGIDSKTACKFLSQEPFTKYFKKTNNLTLLNELVDVLKAGTEAMMEAYAQITAIDVLGLASVEEALKRNLDNPLRKKVTDLVYSGYGTLFCHHDLEEKHIENYYPILRRWDDLVDLREIVNGVIDDLEEERLEDWFESEDESYGASFFYTCLEKWIELTDRKIVSELMFEKFGDTKAYKKLLSKGKIDGYNKVKEEIEEVKEVNEELLKLISQYEDGRFLSEWSVEHMAKVVLDKDKDFISRKMGEWFKNGRMEQIFHIANYEKEMYNVDLAKRLLSKLIEEECEKGNLDKLGFVLDLPEKLIDFDNPKISSLIEAYKINKKSGHKSERRYYGYY